MSLRQLQPKKNINVCCRLRDQRGYGTKNPKCFFNPWLESNKTWTYLELSYTLDALTWTVSHRLAYTTRQLIHKPWLQIIEIPIILYNLKRTVTLPLPRVTGGRYVVQLPKPYLRSKSVIFPTFMATKNLIPYWRKAFIETIRDSTKPKP